MRSIREELGEVIANFPGITLTGIKDLMPHVNTSTLTARLQGMFARGEVLRELVDLPGKRGRGGRSKVYAYSINPDPKPQPKPMRNTTPSNAGLQARIDNLEAVVKELRQWKADAIARYPDLDVDPIILEARKIVAEEIEATDASLAAQVRAGIKDNILPMRVTVAALNRGV